MYQERTEKHISIIQEADKNCKLIKLDAVSQYFWLNYEKLLENLVTTGILYGERMRERQREEIHKWLGQMT